MKTQVFVLVPSQILPDGVSGYLDHVLRKHRDSPEQQGERARFDYLVGALAQTLHDPEAVALLPEETRRDYEGNFCLSANLPSDYVPGALITCDGTWHDLSDFGWRMVARNGRSNRDAMAQWTVRYHELIRQADFQWVVEIWAHS